VLAAEEAGLVVVMDLDEGEKVSAGDVIAELDDSIQALMVSREEALVRSRAGELADRDADLEWARRELERIEVASSRGSTTPQEVDDRRTAVKQREARVARAQGDLAIAEAQLGEAKRRLERMKIRAPFSGVVVRKATEVGEWVSVGDPVAEIIRLDVLDARLDVPETMVGNLRAGESRVRVFIRAVGVEMEAPVSRVIPDADLMSRLFPVRIELPNESGAIMPGMTITGLVPTSQQAQTITVHKDGLLRDDAGEFVYFDASGIASVARVRRLFAVGERVAIEPGRLQPGMSIVVQGNERMFPGQPLQVLGSGEGDRPPG
jgi:RND family efflux transporter MFP subunit